MNRTRLRTIITIFIVASASAFTPVKNLFTAAEQQQISIVTPGLFSQSDAFTIDFNHLPPGEYSFPLPVGKAQLRHDNILAITTKKGDAIKAMFDGTVRLSRRQGDYGNVIVIRHKNGLETMYANNAENLVNVGQHVAAGQTIAIVGDDGKQAVCNFAIMVNGGKINPHILLNMRNHQLRRQTLLCKKNGNTVDVTGSSKTSEKESVSLDPEENEDPFQDNATFRLDLEAISEEHWSYPLPGSHVISPFGGRRGHSGVDIKTKPNDNILAAFDGVVTRSGPYFGYGNCIVIRHAFGFETLYSHQSKNLVKVGQHVKAGQIIGLTGRTGRATTEHLHFETHFRGRNFNPEQLFDHTKKSLQAATLTLSKNGRIQSTRHR